MIARLLVASLAVVLLAGCAAHGAVSEFSDSGIQGTVVEGPTCPVEQAASPCPDRPLAADLVVTGADSVSHLRSGSDGRFRVAVAPGAYTITAGSTGPPTLRPVHVTVPAHTFVSVTLTFDSGIR
jgi:hypothetical protein